MFRARRHVALIAGAIAASTCTISEKTPADFTIVGTDSVPSAAAPVPAPMTPAPSGGAPSTPAPQPANPAPSTNAVRFDGVGPLRVGMTTAEARPALGLAPSSSAPTKGCSYLSTTSGTPLHAFVMQENDTIVRFEVRDATLATDAGARVGDTESKVLELYAGRVTVKPHKYTGPSGHYLVVTTPDNSALRLVFETDGKKVTTYRSGREPQVEFVEECG